MPEEYNNFSHFESSRLEELQIKYPRLTYNSNPQNLITKVFSPTKEQVEQYNKKLIQFFKDYEERIYEIYQYEKSKSLTFQLQLVLSNIGNVPAEDIDIHLYFPSGFDLYDSSKMKEKPILPLPPEMPVRRLGIPEYYINSYQTISAFKPETLLDFDAPTIKKTNSYDVDYNIKTLKHGYNEKLKALSIVFDELKNISSFKIDYAVTAANIPNQIKGQLNVVFH